MKELMASLIQASLISSPSALAQNEEDEIRLLIARAPVAQAMANAEEMEFLIVFAWPMALAYTGHTKEAFAAAAKIREEAKIMESMDQAENDANSFIAQGLAVAGKVDDALSLLRRTKGRSSQRDIIEILATDGRFSEALNEARKAENASDKDYNLKLIAQELAASGEINQALEIASEIKAKNVLNDTFHVVMKELLKDGKLSEARFIAERIQPAPSEYLSLRSVIFELVNDMANDGARENALAMVDLIEKEAERSWPLSVIAELFAKAGKLDEALETARRIKNEFLLLITLAEVAEGFVRKGEIDAARELLNEAVDKARLITNKESQEKAFSSLIPKLAESGLMDEALALANRLVDTTAIEQEGGIDTVATALAEVGRTSEALKLLRSYGKKKTFPHNAVVAIVKKLAQSEKMNEVFGLRNEISLSAALDREIVEGLLKAGKIDDALTVAQNIEDEDDRSEAFVRAAEFLLHSGSYRRARLTADRCPSPVLRMFLYFEIFNVLSFRRNPQLRKKIKNSRLIN
jgi:tetratricopeptide (TPR) repeat protein